jgi:ABC-type Mn2+/Zn2+ transport system permease subunit
VAIGGICALLWRRWLLLSQAAEAAEVAGLRGGRFEILFLCLLAAVLLVGTNALGAVMVLSMLFLPAAAILPWARTIPSALVGATLLSALFLAAGWVMSNRLNLQFSQSVGGMGFAAMVLSHAAAQVRGR